MSETVSHGSSVPGGEPPPPPGPSSSAAGPGAAAKAARTAFGHVFAARRGEWVPRIERRWRGTLTWTHELASPEELEDYLADAERNIDDPVATIGVSFWLRRPYVPTAPTADLPALAITGFAIRVQHQELFAPGRALSDPRKLGDRDQVDHRRLSVEERARARAQARASLGALATPPALVLERAWETIAFFLLARPLPDRGETRSKIEALQRAVASRIEGAVPVGLEEGLVLPLMGTKDGRRFASAVLVEADASRFADIESYTRSNSDPGRVVCVDSRVLKPRGGAPRIPLLRARVLPEDFALEDLELPPKFLGVLRLKSLAPDDARSWAQWFAIEMGLRRFGWQDVAALMRDRRFPFGAHRRSTIDLPTLKWRFESALADSRPTGPAKLPYGIRRIAEFPSRLGVPRRFHLEGGTRAKPFVIQVFERTLMSARRLRRAIEKATGLTLHDIDAEVWDAMVRAALSDARVSTILSDQEPARALTLEEVVQRYFSSATERMRGEVGEPCWPAIHDGKPVFRRPHFEEYLKKALDGEELGRREVTNLLVACGAVEIGTVRFGEQTYRCWSAPRLSRTQEPMFGAEPL